jgi:hypothetical protein
MLQTPLFIGILDILYLYFFEQKKSDTSTESITF